jgi:hypothetical protein
MALGATLGATAPGRGTKQHSGHRLGGGSFVPFLLPLPARGGRWEGGGIVGLIISLM